MQLGDAWAIECRAAFRNVRSRGARAVLAVLLLAVALAANVVVFSIADSLVFHRVPYRHAATLVSLEVRDPATGRPAGMPGPASLDEWRKQSDLFAGVEAYLHKVIFLSGSGEPELVNAADVTTGLVALLGERPKWGRLFVEGDDRQLSPQPVLIVESLARERFGDASRAVGQTLPTTADPLLVVGVLADSFRFPANTQRIWRVFDPHGPLALGRGLTLVARLAPAMPPDEAEKLVAARGVDVAAAVGSKGRLDVRPAPLGAAHGASAQRPMVLVLVAAAFCLLLLACANVASLELAGAVTRARTYAIQLAVGASRGALARTALLEGALIVMSAAAVAGGLAYVAVDAASRAVPRSLAGGTANPIDLDPRTLLFMAGVGAVSWLLSTLPVLAFATRARLIDILKLEGSGAASSRYGTMMRQALTIAQVAIAVMLVAGSMLYARSYVALLGLEKGFDSEGVVSITLTIPPQALTSGYQRYRFEQTLLERIRSRPGVLGAFVGSPPPSTGDSPSHVDHLEVDDRPPFPVDIAFPRLRVTPDYFTVLRIPVLQGRMFAPDDPPTSVMITDALARRLWPDGNAVGHRFRESPTRTWNTVIGVVGHVRTAEDGTHGPEDFFQVYIAQRPPAPPSATAAAPPRRGNFAGPSYGFLTVTARVDSRARTRDLYQAARSVDERNILKLDFVDDLYAMQFADRLLAMQVVTGFGVLAFLVAAAGIYGVMAFLVVARAREIGIRMALGADESAVRRLVLGSSVKLVLAGLALGVAGAAVAARWVQSQLFGISAMDPLTFAAVAVGVIAVALVATWRPARQATRVDPTLLLRN